MNYVFDFCKIHRPYRQAVQTCTPPHTHEKSIGGTLSPLLLKFSEET